MIIVCSSYINENNILLFTVACFLPLKDISLVLFSYSYAIICAIKVQIEGHISVSQFLFEGYLNFSMTKNHFC